MKSGQRHAYRLNLAVWIALLLLLALTAGSAYLPMGAWNGVTNLVIATAKALLVAIQFMHLRRAEALIRLMAGIAVFMLAILFALSGADYLHRKRYPAPWQEPKQLQPWSIGRSSSPAPRPWKDAVARTPSGTSFRRVGDRAQ